MGKTETKMTNSVLISIITPAYNAEKYISETIESVISQDYQNWELLVINNGSTDNTDTIIKDFTDKRLKYLFEDNKGVGFARNKGLESMKGDFFCFLDADDILPTNALSARLEIFKKNPEVDFVDGCVQYVDETLHQLPKVYRPNFKGNPFNRLLKLDSNCLFGNTWMIKRNIKTEYKFDTEMTHAEDLLFYLSLSKEKQYDYTTETILLYRQRDGSAMKNIKGLEAGYILLIKKVKSKLHQTGWVNLRLKFLITKIMILSYIFDGRDFMSAIKSPFKILTA